MILFNLKKKLKRDDFINSVNSDKIWSKELSIKEIKELLQQLKQVLSSHTFKEDTNFFMDGRRILMKRYVQEKEITEEKIKDALFNFWEFVNNEYCGSSHEAAEKYNKSMHELAIIWDKYKATGLICLQEKNEILDMINTLENKISQLN